MGNKIFSKNLKMKFIFLIFLVLASSSLCSRQMRNLRRRHLEDNKYASGCWAEKYNRGDGVLHCESGYHQEKSECKQDCKQGYVLEGKKTCKSTSGNGDSYNRKNNSGKKLACHEGEEKHGGLCFPVCKDGYKADNTTCKKKCEDYNKIATIYGPCFDSQSLSDEFSDDMRTYYGEWENNVSLQVTETC